MYFKTLNTDRSCILKLSESTCTPNPNHRQTNEFQTQSLKVPAGRERERRICVLPDYLKLPLNTNDFKILDTEFGISNQKHENLFQNRNGTQERETERNSKRGGVGWKSTEQNRMRGIPRERERGETVYLEKPIC
mgnify:FL=1